LSESTELLALRLALIGIIFLFVMAAAIALRATLTVRPRVQERRVHVLARLVLETPARTGLPGGTEFDVPGTTTVGRDESNGIVLTDPSISGRHAAIERTARGWVVRDLGSTNGTSVGPQEVGTRGVVLRPGDELRVGAVRFRFFA
jgi:hypothetical protein